MDGNFYGVELAVIHDQDYKDLGLEGARFLKDNLTSAGITQGIIVNLGCGSGHVEKYFADTDFEMIGVDLSPEMIKLAKINAPQAQFICNSFIDFPLPDCVAVTAIGEVFNYLADSRNNYETLISLFKRIKSHLVPGGIFVFDFLEPKVYQILDHPFKIIENDRYTMIIEYLDHPEHQQMSRNITTFTAVEGLYQKSFEKHQLQLFDRDWIEGQLRKIGFEIKQISGYGPLKFRPKHNGYLCINQTTPSSAKL